MIMRVSDSNEEEKIDHIPVEGDGKVPLSPVELILELLRENQGVTLGEVHGRFAIRQFITDNMKELNERGLLELVTIEVSRRDTDANNLQQVVDDYLSLSDEDAARFQERYEDVWIQDESESLLNIAHSMVREDPELLNHVRALYTTEELPEPLKQVIEDVVSYHQPHIEDPLVNYIYNNGWAVGSGKNMFDIIEAARQQGVKVVLHDLPHEVDYMELYKKNHLANVKDGQEALETFRERAKQRHEIEPALTELKQKHARKTLRENGEKRDVAVEGPYYSTNMSTRIMESNPAWEKRIEKYEAQLLPGGKRLTLSGAGHLSDLSKDLPDSRNDIGIDVRLGDPSIYVMHGDSEGVWKNGESNIDFVVTLPEHSAQGKHMLQIISEAMITGGNILNSPSIWPVAVDEDSMSPEATVFLGMMERIAVVRDHQYATRFDHIPHEVYPGNISPTEVEEIAAERSQRKLECLDNDIVKVSIPGFNDQATIEANMISAEIPSLGNVELKDDDASLPERAPAVPNEKDASSEKRKRPY